MSLQPDKLADFVNAVQQRFVRKKWLDISMPLQEYFALELIKRCKMKYDGGTFHEWKVQTENSDNARMSGMFDRNQRNIVDLTTKGTIPHRMETTNWSYSIWEEKFKGNSGQVIIDEIKVREHAAWNDMAILMEKQLWGSPSTPTDNNCHGITYWIQKDPGTLAAPNEGSFTANLPAGHVSVGIAGLMPADLEGWRNWAFGYKAITQDDYVKKCKRAMRRCDFKPAHKHPSLEEGKGPRYEAHTTEYVVEELEDLADSKNDNHGNDVAKYFGQVTVGSVTHRINWHLDATDTTNPVYALDKNTFKAACKTGGEMYRHPVKQEPHQRDTWTTDIDNWVNFICMSRRRQFCGSQVS